MVVSVDYRRIVVAGASAGGGPAAAVAFRARDARIDLAPARRADLAGLAPARIEVGSLDLFHDEDLDYARRLRGAGVPCDVHIVDGAFHGFDLVLPAKRVSRDFVELQRKAIAAALSSRAS